MTQWFTADTHFDHPFIAGDRGFDRCSKHDNALIEGWNKAVHRGDCVVVIGDVFWTNYKHITAIWNLLNGSKILVKGNHDHMWLKKHPMNHHYIYEHSYKIGGDTKEKQKVVCCHYPMRSWNRKKYGAIHLHGHSHGKILPHWRMLDVGMDVAKVMFDQWRPFSLEEIIYLTQDRRFNK
jgi:calcineurin-like phosphoesterase family protein